MSAHPTLHDRADSFGWISILLHWATAVVVVALWFIGQSIYDQPSADGIDARRQLHVTLGLSGWLLLAGRIAWRVVTPHPRVAGQSLGLHRTARSVHYLMLGLLSVMLVTGPMMAFIAANDGAFFTTVHRLHEFSANALLALVAVHVLAALKHLMFHEDETVVRMLMPKK